MSIPAAVCVPAEFESDKIPYENRMLALSDVLFMSEIKFDTGEKFAVVPPESISGMPAEAHSPSNSDSVA